MSVKLERPPRWGFFGRLILDTPKGETYLDRFRLFDVAWFGVYLHRFDAPDWAVDLHDHPYWFAAFILRGGYVEEIPRACPMCLDLHHKDRQQRTIRWFNFKRARPEDRHRVVSLSRTPTWTLVIRGPRTRPWGFHTESGWVFYQDYEAGRV